MSEAPIIKWFTNWDGSRLHATQQEGPSSSLLGGTYPALCGATVYLYPPSIKAQQAAISTPAPPRCKTCIKVLSSRQADADQRSK